MSTSNSQFRTPLSRARGLGASHHGVGHFIAERVSGLALIPLFLWGAFAGIRLAGSDFDTVAAWVAIPINAVLLSLLFIALLVHLKNAIQVVIEDYVVAFAPKAALVIGNLFLCMLAGAAGIVSILKIAFTGAL
ncbi:succinate dehydrogenase, hydrophobic membrane anchor protein [Caulobacter endophyticus]|jgi:succinate dehydrogenase / fumarate reductase membrane anchor subunit|uniref:Succinate dehydrogenase hydrophobic membrane anchor subunit n=1 Tax=Caulobacter endophyticus TaxID=2172652 RepID=A0A2T9JKY9_9CAUL|nr:succinate dehydrogenase, hydrophobic membrane anchor protein [Caulobacter endophyticus]PVM84365.1 succinate dehydrogenase, hydrophobic membrane anchor protein [Caulobacter endophyticus]